MLFFYASYIGGDFHMSKRVNVTIPDDVEQLLDWMVKYDPEFNGKDAAVVAHFFAKGIRAAYEEELKSVPPMDVEEFRIVAEFAHRTTNRDVPSRTE
jgi:hypothetical protein